MISGKTILLTGGTGSFGTHFVSNVLDQFPHIKSLIIYSRDELKQSELQHQFPSCKYPQLKFVIGNIRDKERLVEVSENVDYIIHAAALKQVPVAEENPIECIKTNVFGAENVVYAALKNNVEKVIALSTDKASAPTNLYGASKLCSDKIFIAANKKSQIKRTLFSVVRYGNVLGSRGSVVPLFLKQKNKGVFTVTHPEMTRFHINLDQAVNVVIEALNTLRGGEIFVPKLPSYSIKDITNAIDPKADIKLTGIRPGEKIHEELVSESESYNTVELGNNYIILSDREEVKKFTNLFSNSRPVPNGFIYASHTNTNWIKRDELQYQIKKFVKTPYQLKKDICEDRLYRDREFNEASSIQ